MVASLCPVGRSATQSPETGSSAWERSRPDGAAWRSPSSVLTV